jgi:digeranylgeranylglycerophospholipid reductase
MYDVIIAGGGPTGSQVAYGLAAKGHRVLVLEKNSRPGKKSACTGIVSQECADVFDIEDSVILRKIDSASLFSPSGRRLRLRREVPQACILDRAAFDNAMAERAQRAGADYSFNHHVTDIIVEKNQVTVIADYRGKVESTAGRAAVIASGFSPGLLGRLGLGFFKDFAFGAQAEVEAPGLEEVEVYFGEMAPGFFAWVVPVAPPLARAGLLSRENPGAYLKKWLGDLKAQGKIASSEVKISYGGIPLKPLTRSYGERVLVVGDAAGQVKPTTGGGIYYGLIGADIAAATLDRALGDDDLSARRLAGYQREWRKRLGRELRTGYWFRRLFERLSDRQIDRLFEIVEKRGIDTSLLKAEDISFDWHARTIMRLLKYQVVAKTVGHIRLPFKIV